MYSSLFFLFIKTLGSTQLLLIRGEYARFFHLICKRWIWIRIIFLDLDSGSDLNFMDPDPLFSKCIIIAFKV
jgi:hypothetical protein